MSWWNPYSNGRVAEVGADKGPKSKGKKLTPRQVGRRWGMVMATLVVLLQILRIYIKRKMAEDRLREVSFVDSRKTVHNVTCAPRETAFVPSCSPIKCGRVVMER